MSISKDLLQKIREKIDLKPPYVESQRLKLNAVKLSANKLILSNDKTPSRNKNLNSENRNKSSKITKCKQSKTKQNSEIFTRISRPTSSAKKTKNSIQKISNFMTPKDKKLMINTATASTTSLKIPGINTPPSDKFNHLVSDRLARLKNSNKSGINCFLDSKVISRQDSFCNTEENVSRIAQDTRNSKIGKNKIPVIMLKTDIFKNLMLKKATNSKGSLNESISRNKDSVGVKMTNVFSGRLKDQKGFKHISSKTLENVDEMKNEQSKKMSRNGSATRLRIKSDDKQNPSCEVNKNKTYNINNNIKRFIHQDININICDREKKPIEKVICPKCDKSANTKSLKLKSSHLNKSSKTKALFNSFSKGKKSSMSTVELFKKPSISNKVITSLKPDSSKKLAVQSDIIDEEVESQILDKFKNFTSNDLSVKKQSILNKQKDSYSVLSDDSLYTFESKNKSNKMTPAGSIKNISGANSSQKSELNYSKSVSEEIEDKSNNRKNMKSKNSGKSRTETLQKSELNYSRSGSEENEHVKKAGELDSSEFKKFYDIVNSKLLSYK